MASIIEFRLPIDQFALAHTSDRTGDLRIEIEQLVAHDTGSAMPLVWVESNDPGGTEAAMADDPSIETFSLLANCEEERLYRIQWTDEIELVIQILLQKEGALMEVETCGDSWTFRAMCPQHHSISELYEFCEENGLSLTVDSIYGINSNDGSEHGLTEAQYETLLHAKQAGFYAVPREVSLCELATELDISHQALSERLRRAHGNLIDRTLNTKGSAQIKA